MDKYSWTATLGRILLSLIFIWSGFGKLMDPAATHQQILSAGIPFPPVSYWAAVAVEPGGGIALAPGLATRLAAALLALFAIAAALFFHTNFADQNQFIHFFKNIAMAGGLLYIMGTRAGAYGVDALFQSRA